MVSKNVKINFSRYLEAVKLNCHQNKNLNFKKPETERDVTERDVTHADTQVVPQNLANKGCYD